MMIKLKKSDVLCRVKVGTSAGEFAAREMEALGLRSYGSTENEKTAYAVMIIVVPILIIGSVLYSYAK